MGLYHYLLTIKIEESLKIKEFEEFFISKNFKIIHKSKEYISMIRNSKNGEIEVFLDKSNEISIRTRIHNDKIIINEIILILQQFSEKLKRNINVFDVQNKTRLDMSNLQNIEDLYIMRQNELKEYF